MYSTNTKTQNCYCSDLVPNSSSHNIVIEDTLTDETLTRTKLSHRYYIKQQTSDLTVPCAWRSCCRCECRSWRIETPNSSVSKRVRLLSLILSPDWLSLSVDISNLPLWSAPDCTEAKQCVSDKNRTQSKHYPLHTQKKSVQTTCNIVEQVDVAENDGRICESLWPWNYLCSRKWSLCNQTNAMQTSSRYISCIGSLVRRLNLAEVTTLEIKKRHPKKRTY